MRISRTKLLAVSVFIALTDCASAVPITWTLNGVNFNVYGSGNMSGSFVYNADTGIYSSIDLTSANWGTISSGVCVSLCANGFFTTANGTGDLTGDIGMTLSLDGPLTDAGGMVAVDYAAAGLCSNAACTGLSNQYSPTFVQYDFGQTGTVQAEAATPEPTTLGLLSIGLTIMCMIGTRRNRRV